MRIIGRYKNNAGITLIALVITIIILLILAGVTISLVAGNSGILKRATEAVSTSEKAKAIEQVSMAWVACQTDCLSGENSDSKSIIFSKENLNASLSQGEITEVSVGVDTSGTSELVYRVDDAYYKIEVTGDGEVSIVGDIEITPPTIREPLIPIYSITKILTGDEITFSNIANIVEEGTEYNTTITMGTYYTLESITVKMGEMLVTNGITIEDDAKYGMIHIANVTGNIEMTVVAKTPVTSEIYQIKDGYITKIKGKTTVKEFLDNITVETEEEITVRNKKDKVLDEDDTIATNMSLTVGDLQYILVVRGDVDGNGLINSTDLSKLRLYTSGHLTVEEPFLKAADMDYNGVIDSIDVEKLNLLLVGVDIDDVFSILNIKIYNEKRENNVFQEENIIISFNNVETTQYYAQKMVVNGTEYDVIKNEDTYEIVIEGFSEAGEQTITLEKAVLNNGQQAEINESCSVTILEK